MSNDTNIGVPVTDGNPVGEVQWCITKGYGDLSNITLAGWKSAPCFEDAILSMAVVAKDNYPSRFRQVWSYNYMEDGSGIVCDFGDYTYFGFVKGKCIIQAPAPEIPELPPGRPEKECSAYDYLESEDGSRLRQMFDQYLGVCLPTRLSWWQSHALEYCLISEWWSMFSDEEPSIGEIWKYSLSPVDIYDHVLRWAANDGDGAEILLQSSPDARWNAFHRAFTWGEE